MSIILPMKYGIDIEIEEKTRSNTTAPPIFSLSGLANDKSLHISADFLLFIFSLVICLTLFHLRNGFRNKFRCA